MRIRYAAIAVCLLIQTSFIISNADEPVPAENKSLSVLEEFQEAGMPDEILFVLRKPSVDGHWYANIGYYAQNQNTYPHHPNGGGKLCIYNVKTKQVRTIFEQPTGSIRDPQLHYDGKKILFSCIPNGKKHYSLFEINLDGTGLKQLTGVGEDVNPAQSDEAIYSPPGWDDYEPTYLPDDSIVFVSTRANRYVQCWKTQVGTIHKCNADGSDIRPLSPNLEHDNTPWVTHDGKIAYMRWEYIDRYHMAFHHLWSMNPDGTRQMVMYGNQIGHGTILDVKPVPNSSKVIVTWSPGHGMKEHYGKIALIDPRLGPDDPQGVQYISLANEHTDPWAFDEDHILASNRTKVVLFHQDGKPTELFSLTPEQIKEGFWIAEPRPIMTRERERIISDQTNRSLDYGTLALVNVYHGRKMQGVKPGTITKLRIYEALPKPINYTGAMAEMSAGGTFSVEKFLGEVPVSPDGSAYFKLPALKSCLFLAVDADGRCVKRMHSFTSVMPGENTTCIGCHELRTDTPTSEDRDKLFKIMRRPPDEPVRPEGIPEFFDYARDIQPILDKYCLECHNPDREDGGFNVSGHWGPLFSIGYFNMSIRRMFADNRNITPYEQNTTTNFEPYRIGTGCSTLLQIIEKGHPGVQMGWIRQTGQKYEGKFLTAGPGPIAMSEQELNLIKYWIDAGAPNAATYCVNCWGTIGCNDNTVNLKQDFKWEEGIAMHEAIQRRCYECHAKTPQEKKIGHFSTAFNYEKYYPAGKYQNNMYVPFSMSMDGGRFNRHLVFDLSYPDQSKVLRAPLSREAGGTGICQARSGQPVFENKDDPDYQKILAGIERGRKYILEESNRYTMCFKSDNNGADCPVRFVPRRDYVREMIRYGVLPPTHDFNAPLDPFDLDQRYWETFDYKPVKE